MAAHKSLNEKLFAEVYLGKKIKVIASSDMSKQGIEGQILGETKNLFLIETTKGQKKIPKKECVFEIEINKNFEMIDGKNICYNIAERIKKYG
ncbi:MAG: hypothetical protein COT14_01625 [Candidatus Diapherotrites archaeon CG08_land_8_20_14_0_20_30_16]|nr:MAG: hypothetical protein COT14_01625 [Candidatus Diapherotrites archaeon CG08_land_8_20_14_0_20_30_16]